MGNDGGSIPTRRELVKSAARVPTISELKATALEALTYAWQTDPISSDPLDLANVVADWRGRLYNYETVLRGLMPGAATETPNGDRHESRTGAVDRFDKADDKAQSSPEVDSLTAGGGGGDLTFAATGIRSLRDVVRLHGTPDNNRTTNNHKHNDGGAVRWQCPVSLKELGPGSRAVYLVPCGHVFSETAVETFLPDKLCPTCSAAFAPENVLPVLPIENTELARLQQRMDRLRAEGLTHSLKKDKSATHHGDDKKKKKTKKRKADAEAEAGTEGNGNGNGKLKGTEDHATRGTDEPPSTKRTKESATQHRSGKSTGAAAGATKGIASRINNPLTASLTAKVLAEQEALQKRRRLAESRG
ncbi:DUF602 domain containing protein [Niveomyces insectorum RCEF 264]|uniref:DUF602 domain containing protein n=1 Tax=Niveomyces insectorum RCEF 264 TaxID=1081102 RepID=A0A167XWG7_9HYPO|nr:DUF602 domain containing protein [Niveomyces insectorum RCEF 264]